MTERLAEIGARIDGVHQLAAVVNAMRGIAAARVQQARGQLAAVDQYATTIAISIGRAAALVPPAISATAGASNRPAIVLFCAEQGFAGAFSDRVLDAADADLATAELFLIGTRGAAAAAERSIVAHWKSVMPSHSAGVPKLADQVAEALYARIAVGAIDRLDAVFAEAGMGGHLGDEAKVVRQRLFPLDTTRFPRPRDGNAPLLNLPPELLLSELTADYLHARLCRAALHAFAAENAARMRAMEAARQQIDRQLATLQATERQVRQEEITAEIIELAAGETASRR
jgi:F-type H+-transporting ATPase subunit gamma